MLGRAGFISYLMCFASYVIGSLLGFWNVVLTWQFICQGSTSGINKFVALLISIGMLLIEQLVFGWVFEPDKAVRIFVPNRLMAPPPNPDPYDKIITFYYRCTVIAYHLAKALTPVAFLCGVAALYVWDYISTLASLDYANQLSRVMVAIACVGGTEVLFRVASEHWKWAKLGGDPNPINAFRGMTGRPPTQPVTATPPKGKAEAGKQAQPKIEDFLG